VRIEVDQTHRVRSCNSAQYRQGHGMITTR
ncbi:uncharacterized protein METZ01_LOCUS240664, partial [marine metagenome]